MSHTCTDHKVSATLIVCWIFSELIDSVLDKTEPIAKTFFMKYLTKLRMNVKNMILHY